jgi:RNA polymerase sigma-70 factor (ECF subfamily)
VTRIAYNVYYDYRRSQRQTEDIDTVAVRAMSSQHVSSGEQMDIYQALAQLKDDERTCITLQLIDGYPIDQIATMTGIQPNTVKSHLKRGKEKLANYLRENGYDR